jgi:hypothetical protein
MARLLVLGCALDLLVFLICVTTARWPQAAISSIVLVLSASQFLVLGRFLSKDRRHRETVSNG